jgi:hypothetical protein
LLFALARCWAAVLLLLLLLLLLLRERECGSMLAARPLPGSCYPYPCAVATAASIYTHAHFQ